MKHTTLYTLAFALMTMLAFTSCKENEYEGYNAEGSVYFQLNKSNWNYVGDSISYSFAGKDADEGVVKIRVNLLGNPSNVDRTVRIRIIDEKTTAKEGLHYSLPAKEFTLKAGEMQLDIPVTVYNKDELLTEQQVEVVIALEATNQLSLKMPERSTARIIISNILKQPSYWDDMWMDYIFGPYDRDKHAFMIKLLGRDFPENMEDFDYYYWMDALAYLNVKYEEIAE